MPATIQEIKRKRNWPRPICPQCRNVIEYKAMWFINDDGKPEHQLCKEVK